MKRVVLLTLLLVTLVASKKPNPKTYYSQVYNVNGVEAYILAEPVRPYDIVLGNDKTLNFTSLLTGGLVNNSISTKVSKMISGVVKKTAAEGLKIDAVIYTSGKNITAIKFTDEPTDETLKKARVQKLSGIPVFVMSEPYDDYRVTSDKGGGVKMKSLITAGLINNSIEEDLEKFVKKMKRKYEQGQIDALLYTGGKKVQGIKFK